MPKVNRKSERNGSGANLGFEEKLWQAADKMRGHMDPGEYKHVALGLIFLKYISDAFEDRKSYLGRETAKAGSPMFVKEPGSREQVLEDRERGELGFESTLTQYYNLARDRALNLMQEPDKKTN